MLFKFAEAKDGFGKEIGVEAKASGSVVSE